MTWVTVPLRAGPTLVRLLARVSHSVVPQSIPTQEPLGTDCTLVWPLSGVDPSMPAQDRPRTERLEADCTLVLGADERGLPLEVSPEVSRDTKGGLELGSADSAMEGLLFHRLISTRAPGEKLQSLETKWTSLRKTNFATSHRLATH